ncbi:M1 family aminopeptidase [Kribbella sp. WER1]
MLKTVALAAAVGLVPSAGIGDQVWPQLGNSGYAVVDQQLAVRFNQHLTAYTATTTLTARATSTLSRFDLDLLGPKVTGVQVNGVRSAWKTTPDGELVITPAHPVRNRFVVRVDVVNDLPDAVQGGRPPFGLLRHDGWVQTINQPAGARRILAVSDHPAQKAPATISVTAPTALNSIANGKLLRTLKGTTYTTRVFREQRKLATELLQIGVGPFTVLHSKGPHGLDLRYAVPTAQLADIKPQLASFDSSVRFLEQRLGRFPGSEAGSFVTPLGGELETQGLTLMTASAMTKDGFEQNGTDGVVLHEVAHEWFGNSVSPRRWSDVWLNEGHASFYEDVYAEGRYGAKQEAVMRDAYEKLGDKLLANGPIAAPDPKTFTGERADYRPYSNAAYAGGALTLYALQQKVGARTFNTIERAWVSRYNNSVAGTADFIKTASDVAGTDLGAFLRSWLYSTHLPPMPGHPDWKPPSS